MLPDDELEPTSIAHVANGGAFIPCTPKRLDVEQAVAAAHFAVEENPANESLIGDLWPTFHMAPTAERIALLNNNKWGAAPQTFSVYFFDAPAPVAERIVLFANEWSKHCNKKFARSNDHGSDCRISLGGGGYWSYVGTDNRAIPLNQPTMNLERFSLTTPESEYHRVVCHEFGHFLGCPHEHVRREIVARLNTEACVAYFRRTNGWPRRETIRQVLTPIEESALLHVPGFEAADDTSIMAYQLSGELTLDGRPVPGGTRINARDAAYIGRAYPKAIEPPAGVHWIAEVRSSDGRVLRGNLEDVT